MNSTRSLGLRCEVEEVNYARLQRVLRTDNEKSLILDQLLQNLRPVTQMIHRSADIGAHRLLDERVGIGPDVAGEDGFDRRAHPVDN